MRLGVYAVLFMLFFACTTAPKLQSNSISFSDFFEKEMASSYSGKKQLNKRLTYNQAFKQILLSNIDWKHELAPFLELNFPNTAQQKDYQLQRINLPNKAYCIRLNALNNQAKYKFIQVLFVHEQIQSITVYSNVSSFTQNTSNFYRYVTGKSYRIESAYQIKTMTYNKYAVEGLIIN